MLKKYKIEIIVFAAAMILRLAFAFFVFQSQDYNSGKFFGSLTKDGYYEIADNLIHHKAFSYFTVEPFAPTSARTPVYPIIIAVSLYLFNSLWPFLALQIIIGSLLPVLGRIISLEITRNIKISNFAALLLIIEPVGILQSLMVLTETLFTFFFLLFSWFIIKFIKVAKAKNILIAERRQTVVAAAIFLGLATLTKPTTFYLPIVLIAGWLIYRYLTKQVLFLKLIAAFLLIFIIIAAPWLYRNYKVFGVATIASSQEEVLFSYLAPSILSLKNKENFSLAQTKFFASYGLKSFPEVNAANARQYKELALKEVKNNPKELAQIAGINLFSFFTHDGMLAFLSQLGLINPTGLTAGKILREPLAELYGTLKGLIFSPAIFIILMRVLWLIISSFFFLRAIGMLIKKEFTPPAAFALICVLYFALTTIANGLAVNARFRFPVETFILIFAVSFIFEMKKSCAVNSVNG